MSKGAGVSEAKVEKNRSDFGKASVRNKRKFGTEGEPLVGKAAIFRQEGDRGDLIDKRREEHKAKRGVKEDFVTEVIENDNPDANVKKIDVMKGKNKVKINPNMGEQNELAPAKPEPLNKESIIPLPILKYLSSLSFSSSSSSPNATANKACCKP